LPGPQRLRNRFCSSAVANVGRCDKERLEVVLAIADEGERHLTETIKMLKETFLCGAGRGVDIEERTSRDNDRP